MIINEKIIINIPEQKTETRTIIKEVPVEKKTATEKRKDEIDW